MSARTEAEIEDAATAMASEIIERNSRDVAHIDNARDRLAEYSGRLQAEIRSLCLSLAWARENTQ